ncbi:MAG: TOBE domain-containing protein [Bacillota bacterium]
MKDVVKGAVMAKVVMDYKGDTLVSMITIDSVTDLDLKPGDQVTALVKSTEMLVMK